MSRLHGPPRLGLTADSKVPRLLQSAPITHTRPEPGILDPPQGSSDEDDNGSEFIDDKDLDAYEAPPLSKKPRRSIVHVPKSRGNQPAESSESSTPFGILAPRKQDKNLYGSNNRKAFQANKRPFNNLHVTKATAEEPTVPAPKQGAHLKDFDIKPALSLCIRPCVRWTKNY